jgi:hypothetical protein
VVVLPPPLNPEAFGHLSAVGSTRMKLLMPCVECPLTEVVSSVELRDDAYYEVECRQGHRRSAILTEHKCAVLFESGAMALLDG